MDEREMPVTAVSETDCTRVTILAPPGTDPVVVAEMARRLAENARRTGMAMAEPAPPEGASDGYREGWQDARGGRDPDPSKLGYGADGLNDYEQGFADGEAGRG